MKVLVACEYSGTVRDAFTKRGHDTISCDILPTELPGNHYQGDVLDILDNGWDMMIAFPPCTHLAVSGARWFKEKRKDGRQQQAIEFVKALWEAPIEKVCLENPVGVINRYLPCMPKPQYIQPYEFGTREQKKTGLWLRNIPPLEPTDILDGPYLQSVWLMPPSKDRGHRRSRTFSGIATAMAEQWG